MRHKSVLLMLLMLLLVLAVAPSAASAMTYDQATDKLFADGYPQGVLDYLMSQGTSQEWGWALGGTAADTDKARYLARELRSMGLNVRLEPVPVDSLTFRSAAVWVGNKKLSASVFPGVPTTPLGGVTGDVVYVKQGWDADYVGQDVAGKLVLIDEAIQVPIWLSLPWVQADLKDAAGIIYCGWSGSKTFFNEPSALGTLPSWYFYDSAPVVYISQNDGDWLKGQLALSATSATMVTDMEYRFASQGNHAYNLVATLKGKQRGTRTIIAAHRDSYWHAAIDDTLGCVSAVTMAKAMTMSGYKPAHDIVLLLTTNEEWGALDSLYSYALGAWYAATQRHPKWVGTTSAFLNLDGPGMPVPLRIQGNAEIKRVMAEIAAAEPSLVPQGIEQPLMGSSTDNWVFSSMGVPGCNFRARSGEYMTTWYHTQYDTPDRISWPTQQAFQKYLQRAVLKFDTGLLPYNMTDRANELALTVNAADLKAAGANGVKVDRLVAALDGFKAEAAAYQTRAATIEDVNTANAQLRAIAKKTASSWTALAADSSVWYPHQQVLKDLQGINGALNALHAADAATARTQLLKVGMYGLTAAYSAAADAMVTSLHQPWGPNLPWHVENWDKVTHMAPIPNLRPALADIAVADFAGAISKLESIRSSEIDVLNERLDETSATLDWVSSSLQAVK